MIDFLYFSEDMFCIKGCHYIQIKLKVSDRKLVLFTEIIIVKLLKLLKMI